VSYFIYQAGQADRTRTAAEQREIDRVNGELVKAFAEVGHGAAAPWRSLRRAVKRGRRLGLAERRRLQAHPASLNRAHQLSGK
jgi:hypothetical protein